VQQQRFQIRRNVVHEIMTLILGFLPISEVRGAIPYAVGMKLPLLKAFTLAVAGNLLPIIPVLLLLESTSNYLRHYRTFDRFFTWLFERTRKRGDVVDKYGALGLCIFVAIPLPMTGAWSGCVAAFVFGVKFWKALFGIAAGVLIAGVIVTCAVAGVKMLW
jgi:uncharacterized membrane protein